MKKAITLIPVVIMLLTGCEKKHPDNPPPPPAPTATNPPTTPPPPPVTDCHPLSTLLVTQNAGLITVLVPHSVPALTFDAEVHIPLTGFDLGCGDTVAVSYAPHGTTNWQSVPLNRPNPPDPTLNPIWYSVSGQSVIVLAESSPASVYYDITVVATEK